MCERDPWVKYGWTDFKKALWNIDSVWIPEWLAVEKEVIEEPVRPNIVLD
jgi:hypothetical protein